MAEGIRIKGQAELERAFMELRREVLTEMRPTLRKVAEPVRALAEEKADTSIRNIGPRWGRMRTGVTVRGVYVAPRSKRQGGSPRPNLAGLLMDRAMQPALDEKQDEVVAAFGLMVDESAVRNGFF